MVNTSSDISYNNFKSKRDLWVACFSLNDRNSIINQVYNMIWNAAVFKLINESRKKVPDNVQGHKEINGTVHYFIDECFFDSQLSATRRLTDTYPLKGKRGVFSLCSLLKDMKDNIHLMTRKNLFLAEGKEYDYEYVEQRALTYGLEKSRSGQGAYWLPHELDSHVLKLRHKQIDSLSGVNENQRRPDDVIREQIFDHLIKKIELASCNISTYVGKNIAHAATQESRDYDNADQVTITLGYLWEAHEAICQVVSFTNLYILSEGHGGFLAVPQYDHLEFIDKPLVSTDGITYLADVWQEFSKETDKWGSWGIENLEQEMGKATHKSEAGQTN